MKYFSLLMSLFFLFVNHTSYALEKKIVVLDPGHDTTFDPGTLGAEGLTESHYTDEYVEQIYESLKSDPRYEVIVTRPNQKTFSKDVLNQISSDYCGYKPSSSNTRLVRELEIRSCIANHEKADAFIAIHFDSPPEDYLKITNKDGKRFSVLTSKFAEENLKSGFAIFISSTNISPTKYKQSLNLAEIVSKNMQTDLDRTPSNYHQAVDLKSKRNINRGYVLVDEKNGIFSARQLSVLRNTKMPAILIEVGVIPDPNELKVLGTQQFEEDFAKAIHKSLNEFFNFKPE